MSVAPQKGQLPQLSLPDGVTVWDGNALDDARRNHNSDGSADRLMLTIDILGARSKESQGLNTVLTSVARLRENRQARMYLLCHDGYGVGILKMGVKKLFVTHPAYPALVEIDPLCVLDFFVDTSSQRRGYGKTLFDAMLLNEGLSPGEVAIDRPSVKFLAFLRKHYGLVEYTPQSNNFVVFHSYFDKWQPRRGRGCRGEDAASAGVPARSQGGKLRVHPGYQGPTHTINALGADTTHRFPLIQTTSQGPSASPDPKKKTAYELQYEEYMREQAQRKEQGHTLVWTGAHPVSSSEVAAAGCALRRRVSPTRSGVQYNIISGAPER
ncbi:uncharacterized protein Tco025E_04542 [Trypanosoma conorhini]|uniref:Alpha-tubulin N-acetyltransferase n=1 Tax=Trypanosoma conorhini TaxID=83891 RepID=A0A422PKT4_9TRYP|nr:uncharacterized protein Tco025E_04542 [Trypanosoma conorhini]RNF18325.1 hypothetical protein Tco025E_04542 [Trypanosoma conorhini]